MSFDVHEYFSKLNGGDVLVAYKGSITTDLINNVLEEIEEKMDGADEQAKIKKKVYNVLVESLQNCFRIVRKVDNNDLMLAVMLPIKP